MLHEAGVVPRLVELLSSNHLKVQLSAAGTLGNILGHLPAACTQAAAADAVPVLIQLITSEPDDVRLQRYAVGALESIIDHAQLSATSMRPAVGPLVQLLSRDDTRTQSRAAGCLWSVVRHDEEGREEALAAGAAEHLVQLLQCAAAIHEVALLHRSLMALGILTPHPTVKGWVQARPSSGGKAVVCGHSAQLVLSSWELEQASSLGAYAARLAGERAAQLAPTHGHRQNDSQYMVVL
jgi:HEAT repeat protein